MFFFKGNLFRVAQDQLRRYEAEYKLYESKNIIILVFR